MVDLIQINPANFPFLRPGCSSRDLLHANKVLTERFYIWYAGFLGVSSISYMCYVLEVFVHLCIPVAGAVGVQLVTWLGLLGVQTETVDC